MTNNTLIIIGFMLLIAFSIEGFYAKRKQSLKNKAEQKAALLMMSGKFDELDEYLSSDDLKKILPKFNIEYLKMNSAIMNGNDKKIEASLKSIQEVKMNSAQKNEVYLNAFNYYVDKENKKEVDHYKDLILKSTSDEELITYINRLYDVKIMKKATYLDEMLKEIAENKKINKATHYLLIAEMYKNINDTKNAEKYNGLYITEMQKLGQ